MRRYWLRGQCPSRTASNAKCGCGVVRDPEDTIPACGWSTIAMRGDTGHSRLWREGSNDPVRRANGVGEDTRRNGDRWGAPATDGAFSESPATRTGSATRSRSARCWATARPAGSARSSSSHSRFCPAHERRRGRGGIFGSGLTAHRKRQMRLASGGGEHCAGGFGSSGQAMLGSAHCSWRWSWSYSSCGRWWIWGSPAGA